MEKMISKKIHFSNNIIDCNEKASRNTYPTGTRPAIILYI